MIFQIFNIYILDDDECYDITIEVGEDRMQKYFMYHSPFLQ
jgi:hypothetical protein